MRPDRRGFQDTTSRFSAFLKMFHIIVYNVYIKSTLCDSKTKLCRDSPPGAAVCSCQRGYRGNGGGHSEDEPKRHWPQAWGKKLSVSTLPTCRLCRYRCSQWQRRTALTWLSVTCSLLLVSSSFFPHKSSVHLLLSSPHPPSFCAFSVFTLASPSLSPLFPPLLLPPVLNL